MVADGLVLTDGGIETVLLFHEGFELPCFAAFPLLEHDRGRAALRRYFEPFLDRSPRSSGLPFVLDTPTWRANPDWGAQLGYDADALAGRQRRAVEFARELAQGRADVTINGVLGPRGDGYVVGERMTADEAADYHGWQIGVLRGRRRRPGHRADADLSRGGDRHRAGRGRRAACRSSRRSPWRPTVGCPTARRSPTRSSRSTPRPAARPSSS